MKSSKYKGVYKWRKKNQKEAWIARYYNYDTKGMKYIGKYNTERDAALAYDRKMISMGKSPVNILKPVKK